MFRCRVSEKAASPLNTFLNRLKIIFVSSLHLSLSFISDLILCVLSSNCRVVLVELII